MNTGMTPERIAFLRNEVSQIYSGEESAAVMLTECLNEIERLQQIVNDLPCESCRGKGETDSRKICNQCGGAG